MSHNTTSWKSHTSTWRWTAGNDGRSPEGGKARQGGGHPALAREKAIGQHDQGKMAMQTIPASALVMVQAALPFGIFIKLRNGPAAMRQFNQSLQGRIWRQGRQHSLGLIERSGAGFARLAPPPWTRGPPEGSSLDLRWQAHPERTAHPHHVGELPVVEALEKGGIVAIASVRDYRGKRDAPHPRLIHQREREFGLCLKGHLSGHMDLAAAGGICCPALRPIEPCPQGPMHWGPAGGL